MQHKTSKSKSLAAMHSFYTIIVLTGFVQMIVPSTIHMLMTHFHLTTGEVAFLPLIYFTGMMISASSITALIKIFSIKRLMISGAVIASISLIAVSQSQIFLLLLVLYIFIGFGNGIMVTLPGIYATNHHSEKNAQLQSVMFGLIALGFVIGPLFPGIVSYFHLSWRWCFALPGLLILPALIPILLAKHSPIDKAEKLNFKIIKEIISFDKRFFIGIVLAIIISSGSSAGVLTWLITFLEEQRSTQVGAAHLILASMGIAAALGRFVWSKVGPKITVYRTLLLIVPIAAIVIFIAPLSKVALTNIVLFFIAMIFVSGVNPLLLSVASVYPKSHSSSAYTILFISMSIGGILIPFGIGHVFQQAGPVIGMSSISLMFIIILGLLLFIKKEMPVSKHMHKNPLP